MQWRKNSYEEVQNIPEISLKRLILRHFWYGIWEHKGPNVEIAHVVLCRILVGFLKNQKTIPLKSTATTKPKNENKIGKTVEKTTHKMNEKERERERSVELLDLLYEWVINSYII